MRTFFKKLRPWAILFLLVACSQPAPTPPLEVEVTRIVVETVVETVEVEVEATPTAADPQYIVDQPSVIYDAQTGKPIEIWQPGVELENFLGCSAPDPDLEFPLWSIWEVQVGEVEKIAISIFAFNGQNRPCHDANVPATVEFNYNGAANRIGTELGITSYTTNQTLVFTNNTVLNNGYDFYILEYQRAYYIEGHQTFFFVLRNDALNVEGVYGFEMPAAGRTVNEWGWTNEEATDYMVLTTTQDN